MKPYTVARQNKRAVVIGNSVILFLQHLLMIVISLLLCASTRAQNAQEAQALPPDQPVERELAGGQTHTYQISLVTSQYLELVVEQRGIDVVVTLMGPDGKRLARFDNDSRSQGHETVIQIVETAGDYRLLVEARQKDAKSGRYTIRLAAPRVATAQDRALQEAPQLGVDVTRLTNAARLDELLPQAERALAVREQTLGQEHAEVATALDRLASIIRNKGDLAKAELLYQRALTIAEKTPQPGHAELGQIYNDLGTLYFRKGDFVQAEAHFQRALETWQQALGPDHTNVARMLTNLAAVYSSKGDRVKAEQMLLRALGTRERTLGTEHPDLINTLINLGIVYFQYGNYDRAEPYLLRAMKIVDKTPGQEPPQLTTALVNLATVYTYKGNLAGGEALNRRALALLEKTVGPEHPDTLLTLSNIAVSQADQGNFAQSTPLRQRVLTLREKVLGPEHPYVARTLAGLARDYSAQGNLSQALDAMSRATTISERNLTLNLAAGSERQKLAFLSTLTEETNQAVSFHLRFAPDDPAAARLSLTSILSRKGRALDAMTDSLAVLHRRATPEDQTLLDQLKDTRAQLARLVLGGPQRSTPAEHLSRIKALEERREKLEDQISRRSSEFRAQTQSVTLEAVQSVIPKNAALVEFAAYRPYNPRYTKPAEQFGAPRYVAYLLLNQGEPQWVELGEKQPIDDVINKLRQSLRDRKRRDFKQLARALDQLVMQPVRLLLGRTRRVIISPDGALNLVPFAALVDPHGHYLVSHYTFSYLTSGRDLLRLQVKQPSKQSALIMANPDFGAEANNREAAERILKYRPGTPSATGAGSILAEAYFPPLPGTEDEAQKLKLMIGAVQLLTKEQATETALKQVSSPSILHIATHGFFLGDATVTEDSRILRFSTAGEPENARYDNPLLQSGLALAGANQLKSGADDGILTALEAAGLDLWGTKLAVLSACETGIGEVKDGEGVYGLRRALVLAGSETQVMSLWPVSDLGTRDLMIDYYRRLLNGEGRSEALRQVQLRMLKGKQSVAQGEDRLLVTKRQQDNDRILRTKSGKKPGEKSAPKDYSHPYYWAGFIQSGEWANLTGQR